MRLLTVAFYFLCWWLFPENCTIDKVQLSGIEREEESKKEDPNTSPVSSVSSLHWPIRELYYRV